MLIPPPEVQRAFAMLRGYPEGSVVAEWLEGELAEAIESFVNAERPERLPVLQNSVRMLQRICGAFNGGK